MLQTVPGGDTTVNLQAWRHHRWLNLAQSMLLLAAMAAVAAALGWVLAGPYGALWALLLSAVLVVFNPQLAPRLILGLYRARPLPRDAVPELHDVLVRLAHHAGLPRVPALYRIPSDLVNAFAVGTRRNSAIAVTDALLRNLAPRELVGVLAHELSHIRHNDLWVIGLADLFSRVAHAFATLGQLLLLINLPLIVLSDYHVSWIAILILLLAPAVNLLMQLALSRTREFHADLGAVELTGDPQGLASALEKMERYHGSFIEQVLAPGRRVPDPSLLRTHPHTADRVRRLLELAPDASGVAPPSNLRLPRPARHPRRPRWHPTGLWH